MAGRERLPTPIPQADHDGGGRQAANRRALAQAGALSDLWLVSCLLKVAKGEQILTKASGREPARPLHAFNLLPYSPQEPCQQNRIAAARITGRVLSAQ